jgi:hypothetical protein
LFTDLNNGFNLNKLFRLFSLGRGFGKAKEPQVKIALKKWLRRGLLSGQLGTLSLGCDSRPMPKPTGYRVIGLGYRIIIKG